MELALRKEWNGRRLRRRVMLVAAVALTGAMSMAPRAVLAEGLFDFLFGGAQKQQTRQAPPQASFFADPNQPAYSPGRRSTSPSWSRPREFGSTT